MENVHVNVKNYYGEELNHTGDLKTNACCTLTPPPKHIADALKLIHEEVQAKYYGCGLTIPSNIKGLKILDLGSGSGRDCYIASRLVGPNGFVVGVDMTGQQLDIANKYVDYHTKLFNYKTPNISFIQGNIEKLDELNLEPGTFDIVISNCVINLAQNKSKVFKDVYKLLKPEGEMYFSDVYSDRRIPLNLQKNRVLWGECLSGALYWNDFLNIVKSVGFTDPRVIEDKPITIENPELENLVGEIKFYSVTYRLWKIDGLETDCEDYGQAVSYKGGIIEEPFAVNLDNHHKFVKGKIESVCGNTFKMLKDTRYAKYFDFYGNWDTHFGIFAGCGGNSPFSEDGAVESDCGC